MPWGRKVRKVPLVPLAPLARSGGLRFSATARRGTAGIAQTTYFHPIMGSTNSTTVSGGGIPSDVAFRVATACTINGFNVQTDGTAGYSTRTITLFYGATLTALSATTLTCSLTTPSTSCSSSNSVAVAAGGYIMMEEVALANATTFRYYTTYTCQ